MKNVVVRTCRKYPVLVAALTFLIGVEGVAIADHIVDHAQAVSGSWSVDGPAVPYGPPQHGMQVNYKCTYTRSPDECADAPSSSMQYNSRCLLIDNGRKSTGYTLIYYSQSCTATPQYINDTPLVVGSENI